MTESATEQNRSTRASFLQALKTANILTELEVDRLDASHVDLDAGALGQLLADMGALTAYQVEALQQGKGSTLLIGNYQILDKLGAGGMGTVYKARHRRMKRIVALKVLAHELGADSSFVQRFQREVETIARLNHPNVVMAFDADEDAAGHFLVMEFVDGRDLASIVQRQGVMDVRTAIDCILQAARGLSYAHAQGIVHRDIKPANLLRDAAGVVKVTDLGLARINAATAAASAATTDSSLTKVGVMMGTADYMPPEQAVDTKMVDQRADIYSLGCTLYYLLLGRGPFTGESLMATLLKHRDAPIPMLGLARAEVPPRLDAVFRRMLAKQPRERPQSMAAVVAELEEILATLAHEVAPTLVPATPVPFVPPVVAAPENTLNIRQPRHETARLCRLLLVEPSRTQAGIIRRYLQLIDGAQIAVVATGTEALHHLRGHVPDAVVSAMHLDDMTGAELAQQVRSACPLRPPGFVLISSQDEVQAGQTISSQGLGITLRKPFSAAELVHALQLATPALAWLSTVAGEQVALSMPQASGVTSVHGPSRSSCRVLIVDDSAAARLHVRGVLRGLGFADFVEAADGAQAVAAVCKDKFSLIITDYNMPLMDGSGFIGYLKQSPSTAAVPIIMVTTEADPEKLAPILKMGVLAICEKSFPVEKIRGIIDRIL